MDRHWTDFVGASRARILGTPVRSTSSENAHHLMLDVTAENEIDIKDICDRGPVVPAIWNLTRIHQEQATHGLTGTHIVHVAQELRECLCAERRFEEAQAAEQFECLERDCKGRLKRRRAEIAVVSVAARWDNSGRGGPWTGGP